MELLMKNIHMYRQAKQVRRQITLDEDFNVPDIRPDVEMIIQSKEKVILENVRTEKEKLFLDGYMEVAILYLDDTRERQIHRLDARLVFAEAFLMEGLQNKDTVRIGCETEDLNVVMINSRKLAIRALISVSAYVDEIYDLSAAVEVQTKLVTCQKKQKLELMQLAVQKKDIFRLKEEVSLPSNKPNIREILWENIQLRSYRIKLQEEKIEISGKLFLFVLYRGEEENGSAQWLEYMIPFEGEMECAGAGPQLVPDIEVNLTQAELHEKEDTDGEIRILFMEGMLELEIRLYENKETEILEDIFSPEKELVITKQEEVCESLVMRNESKCKTGGRIRIQAAKPRILQTCSCNGSVKIDKTQITPEGIYLEGAVPVSILYISSDDAMPFAVMDGTIPFTHLAEIPNLDEDCRFRLDSSLEQLSATMADSEEIEVKAVLGLNLFVVRKKKQQCISAIEEKDFALEKLESIPGITAYMVQEKDSLWKIAKEYSMTPEEIRKMNGMEKEDPDVGDCLILMKSVKMR